MIYHLFTGNITWLICARPNVLLFPAQMFQTASNDGKRHLPLPSAIPLREIRCCGCHLELRSCCSQTPKPRGSSGSVAWGPPDDENLQTAAMCLHCDKPCHRQMVQVYTVAPKKKKMLEVRNLSCCAAWLFMNIPKQEKDQTDNLISITQSIRQVTFYQMQNI